MPDHRCSICGRTCDDACELVPLIWGDEIDLVCHKCSVQRNLPETMEQWSSLRQRRHLEMMGWIINSDDEEASFDEPYDVAAIDLETVDIDPDVISLVSPEFAYQKCLIPVSRNHNSLMLAMSNPDDLETRAEVKNITGLDVLATFAPEEEVLDAIMRYTNPDAPPDQDPDEVEISRLIPEVIDEPIIKLVNLILSELSRTMASEVHIERNTRQVQVLYRIDGLLSHAMMPPVRLGHRLIACFRLLGKQPHPEPPQAQKTVVDLITKRGFKFKIHLSFKPHLSGENLVITQLE